jgi:hypothetical protein
VPSFEAVAGRVGDEVDVEPAGGGPEGVFVDAVDAGLAVERAVPERCIARVVETARNHVRSPTCSRSVA